MSTDGYREGGGEALENMSTTVVHDRAAETSTVPYDSINIEY